MIDSSNVLEVDITAPICPPLAGAHMRAVFTDHRSEHLLGIELGRVRLHRCSGAVDLVGNTKLTPEQRAVHIRASGLARNMKLNASCGGILLDHRFLMALMAEGIGENVPASWEKEMGDCRHICFDGSMFVYPDGRTAVACLYKHNEHNTKVVWAWCLAMHGFTFPTMSAVYVP